MRTTRLASLVAASLVVAACSSSGTESAFDGGGGGGATADGGFPPGTNDGGGFDLGDASGGGGGGSGDGATSNGQLVAVIRDFKLYASGDPSTDSDFENVPNDGSQGANGAWDDHDIVTDTLGADGKPVYKSATTTKTTHGKDAFDKWYRDVAGTNVHVDYPIVLATNASGESAFDSEQTGVPLSAQDPRKMFFPIDDGSPFATPFGDQGDPHNYSFTMELHTKFTYKGGEFFRFRGDDDIFVYIAGKLVINLGGIHSAETAEVNVDTLGLVKGQEYPLDFFSAERHKVESNILFTTTLGLRPADPR